MGPERLLLTFESSPEESNLATVDEVVRAMGENAILVEGTAPAPRDDSLIGKALRFWFPYLSRAGVKGVTPGATLQPASAFMVTFDNATAQALGAWLQQRSGRRVRVRRDELEAEAQTLEEAQTLLSRLDALQQRRDLAV